MIQRFMKSQTNSSVNAYVPEMVRRLRSLEAKAFLLSNPATLVGKDAAKVKTEQEAEEICSAINPYILREAAGLPDVPGWMIGHPIEVRQM